MVNRELVVTACCVMLLAAADVAADDHRAVGPPKGRDHLANLMVRLNPRFGLEGSSVRALIRVERNSSNRLLRIIVDSENYYRSSDIQLDGEYAAASHFMTLKSLPAGTYVLLAVVYSQRGERARVEERFHIISPSEEACEGESGCTPRCSQCRSQRYR